MISAVQWIPRGAVARVPIRQELSKEEIEAIKKGSEELAENADTDMDDRDDNDEDDEESGEENDENTQNLGLGEPDMDYAAAADESDEGEDVEDLVARASDAFLIVANTEDEYSSLEVQVFNEEEGSLYTHHDITLPSYPIALAWSDYAGNVAGDLYVQTGAWNGEKNAYVGNYCAIGYFEPDIEIWNLDVLDPLEPTLILRGNKKNAPVKKSKGGKKNVDEMEKDASRVNNKSGHSDAVMGLSWNREFRNLLASSSADHTVKVWDIDNGGKVLHTFTHHKGKVQSVSWNPVESSILAAASYDRTVSIVDARANDGRVGRYAVTADPESFTWDVHNPPCFIVSTEDGFLHSYDIRNPGEPLFKVRAHGNSISSISLSPLAPNLLATASIDKTVKLWDTQQLASNFSGDSGSYSRSSKNSDIDASVWGRGLVSKKTMAIGQIFSVNFFPNNPYLLAAAGSKGLVAIWNASEDGGEDADGKTNPEDKVSSHFNDRLKKPSEVPSMALRHRPDGQPVA